MQTVGANLCQRHRLRENLSTDSSIAQTVQYINKQEVCYINTEKKRLVYMNLFYNYVIIVLWLTGILGPQEKDDSATGFSNMWE